jgi:pyruvate dehydrogenase E1 component alpha subunit
MEHNDSIKRLGTFLQDQDILTEAQDEALQQQVADDILAAVQFAESSPYPTPDELYKDVYSYDIA